MSLSAHTLPPEQRRQWLQAVRDCGMGRRVYEVHASRPGAHLWWPARALASHARIHEFTAVMFRRTFGTKPTFQWVDEGRAAEAWDDQGHRLAVHQVNDHASSHAG